MTRKPPANPAPPMPKLDAYYAARTGELEAEVIALRQALRRLLAVADELLPGARYLAIQDFGEMNQAFMLARRLS